MIIGIVGYPGSGKTYLATSMLLSRKYRGRKLFSNVPVLGAMRVSLDDLVTCTIPHGSVVLLDEVQGIAPARSTLHAADMWASIPYEVYSYFAEGRKYGVDWLWTCQDGSRADKVPGDSGSLVNTSIERIYKDSKGIIWIGTKSNGISRYNPVTGKFLNMPYKGSSAQNILPDKRVISFCEDSDGGRSL